MVPLMEFDNSIIIVNKTRLEQLIERFNTRAQARFYIEHAGGDFADYEDEHDTFHRALEQVTRTVRKYSKFKHVERKFLPNFLFGENDIVIVVGQDGLVANTAKYAGERPILAVNPDTVRNDGILLPFDTDNFEKGLAGLQKDRTRLQRVTLAQAVTNDGQRLLAFNDLFVGPATHTSARYRIHYHDLAENQSSSGLIVSTGAGSTGWFSSALNMAYGINHTFQTPAKSMSMKSGAFKKPANFKLEWHANKLAFVVREPFSSKHSETSLTAGIIQASEKLVVESFMPSQGVIFSDGMESDFITFNSGTRVEIGLAPHQATLVTSD